MNRSKERIRKVLSRYSRPLSKKEIFNYLKIRRRDIEKYNKALNSLILDYKIKRKSNGKYDLFTGFMKKAKIVTTRGGLNFLVLEDYHEDFLLYNRDLNGAMTGDTVLASVDISTNKAKVVEVINKSNRTKLAIYYDNGYEKYIKLLDERESRTVVLDNNNKLVDGDIIKIEIISWEDNHFKAKFIEKIEDSSLVNIGVIETLLSLDINKEFPEDVLKEAETVYDNLHNEIENDRIDLSDTYLFTIDSISAKDLDDAISIEKDGENYILGVHIADVSHYVREGSLIDKEALKRATSCYLPELVIPMLPESLSNDLCSLSPETKKRALSVLIKLDKNGDIISSEIFKSWIISRVRFEYEKLNEYFEGKDTEFEGKQYINILKELYDKFKLKKDERNAINFISSENEIIIDDGSIKDIKLRKTGISEAIIEECMVLCNRVVGERYYNKKLPFIYRIHDKPSLERVENFIEYLKYFSYRKKHSVKDYRKQEFFVYVLEMIKGKKGESLINNLMLRSMQKAVYSTNNIGHFGLAIDYYSHFTAPIRRYSDLAIHRIIKDDIAGKLRFKDQRKYKKFFNEVAEISTEKQSNAEIAERRVTSIYCAKFLSEKIGESYRATISHITKKGIFASLDFGAEGFITSQSLGFGYKFERKSEYFRNKDSRKSLFLADIITVKVKSVNILKGEIEFELVSKDEQTFS